MSILMTKNTLGDKFVKGMAAKLYDVVDQADKDYSTVNTSVMAVEGNASTSLFMTEYSDKARETLGGLTQFGDLEKTEDTAPFKQDTYKSSYETQFNFDFDYTKRLTISRQNIEDGEAEAKLQNVGRLLKAGKRTFNKHCWDILNYAVTAQASLPSHLAYFGDGKATGATDHPLKENDGVTTTDSNLLTLALSPTNLETARIALMEQLGDRSELLSYGSGALFLIVPHSLEEYAARITKSEKRQGTANNDINMYDGFVTVISSKWISAAGGGSDTRWFLVDANASPLTAFVRTPLRAHAPWVDKENYSLNIDIDGRWQMGPRTWRGIVVSNPS